jgi:PAS domain-containing protein
VVLLDKQLKFAFASDSARRISGYQGDELIGSGSG